MNNTAGAGQGKTRLIAFVLEGTSAKNASFGLARLLKEQGYRIVYLAPEQDREHVERQGFRFDSLQMPYVSERQARKKSWWQDKAMHIRQRYNERVQVHHFVDQWLRQHRPDLVLLDNKLLKLAAPFLKKKVPIVNINPNLSNSSRRGMPPVFTGLMPALGRGRGWQTLRIRLAWQRLLLNQHLLEWQERLFALLVLHSMHYKTSGMQVRELGARLVRSDYGLRLAGPELVLGPQELDFPGPPAPDIRCYAGISVDQNRKDQHLGDELPAGDRPYIYCSLGTHSTNYFASERFYRCLLTAMKEFPQYLLLLQAEGFDRTIHGEAMPDNVRIFRQTSQLRVLQDARLFITHGGFSSVREAVLYGVPMIVFPGWHDQAGNAARIAFHGLGLRGNMKKVTVSGLTGMIRQVLNDPRMRQAMKNIQQTTLGQERSGEVIDFIEAHFSSDQRRLVMGPLSK